MVYSHLEFVQQSIDRLDEKIDKMVVPYESAITLLCTIPGVDKLPLSSSPCACTVGQDYHLAIINMLLSKNPFTFHVSEYTLNLHWCKSPMLT